jgi:SOS response regulatory protein OraA/RecX
MAEAAISAAFEEVGEADRALEAGRRRLPGLLRGPSARVAARLSDHLLRRGYPASTVRRAVRTLLADRADDLPTAEEDDGGV